MKRLLSLLMATVLAVSFAGVSALAWEPDGTISFNATAYNADGEDVTAKYGIVTADGSVKGDAVRPGKEVYFELEKGTIRGKTISADALSDSNYFSFKLDRDKNSSLLKSVDLSYKNLNKTDRKNYVKVILKDSNKTDESKVSFDVYFKADKDDSLASPRWKKGDIVSARFTLWVDNEHVDGEDADVDTGDGVVFKPISNETNTITWGIDNEVASLKFDAGSNADKFYAKLSTKTDQDIYTEYGDPVDADLYFRTFVGNPTIDSTSRGTLTLYNPWSEYYNDNDDRYNVNPEAIYIYTVDSDGYLEDVTSNFTYVDEDKTDAGIDGWQVRVRTLGSYIISDTDLDVGGGIYDEPVDYPENQPNLPSQKPGPAPAPTGSHDFLAVAVALAAVSAGTIVFVKKRR